MRLVTDACATVNAAIASYFAAAFSLDATRLAGLPLYGLEELRRSELIFALGRLTGLDAPGLIWLAACLLATELAIAGVFAAYLLNRLFGTGPTKATGELLQAALVLVGTLAVVAAVPALMTADGVSIRLFVVHLGFAGLAAILEAVERRAVPRTIPRPPAQGPAGSAPTATARWHDPSVDGWFSA